MENAPRSTFQNESESDPMPPGPEALRYSFRASEGLNAQRGTLDHQENMRDPYALTPEYTFFDRQNFPPNRRILLLEDDIIDYTRARTFDDGLTQFNEGRGFDTMEVPQSIWNLFDSSVSSTRVPTEEDLLGGFDDESIPSRVETVESQLSLLVMCD
jgi:hypothetical protein